MSCLICGDPKTVGSHILPKSAIRLIKGDAPHVIRGSLHKPGQTFSQSGEIDHHLLCHLHESMTGPLDKYGVEFIRRAEAAFPRGTGAKVYEVTNADPRKLFLFALSVVWRSVNSEGGRLGATSLGSYEAAVREAVFATGALSWPLIVARNQIAIGDAHKDIRVGATAGAIRVGGARIWKFMLAEYSFFLFADQRGAPKDWVRYLADRDPAPVIVAAPVEFHKSRAIHAIMQSMMAPRS